MSAPSRVQASNCAPRVIAPDFGEVPCLRVVDRSVEPVVSIPYTIETEALPVATDVPGSKRHFFFAFPAHVPRLPTWLRRADADRAQVAFEGDPACGFDAPDDSDLLEGNPLWPADRWISLSPREGVPITHEAAARGLTIDTTTWPGGAYVIAAYTFWPPTNGWVWRMGALVVTGSVDGNVASPLPPAVFVRPAGASTIREGVPGRVEGCVDAPPGSTVDARYALARGSSQGPWIDACEPLEVRSGDVSLDLVPRADIFDPGPLADGLPYLHVELAVTSPEGRRSVAALPTPWRVETRDPEASPVPGPTASDCEGLGTPRLDDGAGCSCRAFAKGVMGTTRLAGQWPWAAFVFVIAAAWARRRARG